MKILRIIARLNVGGPARHVVWLTSALQDEEFQSKLIAGTVPAGERDMAHFADSFDVEPSFIKEMSRELSAKDLISVVKVFREIRRARPDIIHTHTAKAGTVGRVAALLHRLTSFHRPRIVHTFHGHVFHSYYGKFKTQVFLTIEKLLARLATDRIIAISAQQYHEIHEKFGVGEAAQFQIIPLGIDLAQFDNLSEKRSAFRQEISAGENDIIVGFVGRLTEIKNIPLLLESAAICLRQRQGMKFVIAGDGHLRPALESRTAELKIADSVRFLGDRRDPEYVYAGVDIVALTSLNEGTPLSLIEAMASERPFVSTSVGGVCDLLGPAADPLRDNVNVHERGIAVAAPDPEAFASAIQFLADDVGLRQRLAAAGRRFVVENYSKERLIRDIKTLYRNLLK